MLVELAIGITLAGLTILLIQTLSLENNHKMYAVALIIAASIYLGFSLLSQNTTWIFTETVGTITFSLIAFIGVKFSPWFLAMGWLIHPVWDLLIDNHKLTTFVPYWYPTFCIGYDIVIALYIVWKCIKPQEKNSFTH